MIRELPIDRISLRADARAIDDAAVAALSDSIANVGLINPIRVRAAGDDRWEVIAGAHRITACKRLGLAEVAAIIVTDDDLHAELAMIDENLCRAELSPSDRAKQTARRKAIYLELHPETAHGANLEGAGVANSATPETPRFTKATAAVTGQSERTVRLDAERGEKIYEPVFDMIRGTKLDNGSYLDRIKNLSPSEQVRAAERDLAWLASQERQKAKDAKSAKIQADVKARAAREVAEIIAEHVPGSWWDAIKSNLYAAGAKNIGDAFSNIVGESVIDRSAASAATSTAGSPAGESVPPPALSPAGSLAEAR